MNGKLIVKMKTWNFFKKYITLTILYFHCYIDIHKLLKGRDYQPRKQKHHFTEEEKGIMATFESAPLKPSHTAVYRHWLASLPPRSDTESWIIIALIAVIIGILTFVMKITCEKFQIFYNPFMKNFVEVHKAIVLNIYYIT